MKSSNMDEVLGRVEKSVQNALTKISRTLNQSADEDLALYDSLDVRDFDVLAEKYGRDQILSYIQQMESKRMLGENNYGKIKFRHLS